MRDIRLTVPTGPNVKSYYDFAACFDDTVKEASENSDKFERYSEDLSKWIVGAHENMAECHPVLAEDGLLERQKILRSLLQTAEDKKQNELKDINHCGDKLKVLCLADATSTDKKQSNLNTDMDKLIAGTDILLLRLWPQYPRFLWWTANY